MPPSAAVASSSTGRSTIAGNGRLDELAALRLLLENSSDLLSRHSADGLCLWASGAARSLLGYAPDDLVGRPLLDLVHPDDRDPATEHHRRVRVSTGVESVECRMRHADGSYVWMESNTRAIRDDETGELLELQATSRDVSARKAAESRLAESEQRFRLAMANAPIGMALIGLDGSWVEVNDRVSEIVGRTPEALRELTFQDITHPDDLDADLAYLEQLLDGEIQRYSMEKRYFHAQGHIVWILLSVSLVRGRDDEPLYFIAQIQDITARKHYERELRRLNDELAQSNRELQRFAAVASHDLRAPLTVIGGMLDLTLMQYGGQLAPEAADWLGQARTFATSMAQTIDAVLQLASIGQGELERAPVALRPLVDEVLATLGPQVHASGAVVDIGQLPEVIGDRALLRLLLQNLIGNALKFRRPDRDLRVDLAAAQAPDDQWAITVTDNGRGFAAGDVERLFEPFERSEAARDVAGVGIGLATCRRIVERHGGRITARPLLVGAAFEFTLPAMQARGRAAS